MYKPCRDIRQVKITAGTVLFIMRFRFTIKSIDNVAAGI
jgi:hypothetical protein